MKKTSSVLYYKKVDPNLPASPNNNSLSLINSKKFLLLVLGAVLVIALVFYLWNQKNFLTKPAAPASTDTNPARLNTSASNQAIAKVGEEYIYQKDLDMEIQAYGPASNSAEIKNLLLQKMVTDSIILQGGQADKLITLDPATFNSPEIDYINKRIPLVTQVKKNFLDKYSLSGAVVSIWFDNDRVSTDGDEARKKIAFNKISKLQQAVKNGQITIKQAGDQITADSSLAALDPVYKSNAYFTFSVSPKDKISFDDNFNNILRGLNEGETSDVTLVQAHQKGTGKLIDAVYMFGTIAKKSGQAQSFEDWLAQKRKIYEVKIY